MLTTLTLKRAEAPVRAATAWLLPGGDAAAWLEELLRWPGPVEAVQLYLLTTPRGTAPVAALAVLPEERARPRGNRAQPYGLAAPGVYVPVDAVIWPPVTPEELRAATKFPVLVFHPALGLTGCDPEDVKRVEDLLIGPARQIDVSWSAARAGPLEPSALGPVHLDVELSMDGLFGQESKDIGSEPLDLLPPSPGERDSGPATRFAQGATGLLAKGLLGMTALVPRTAFAPTWLNGLEGWVQQKLSGLTKEMERARHKELNRLLDQLVSNPEEGLRHAIPLAAMLNRGLAQASAQLGRRATDFNLGRLGGGRAADAWDVPGELRAALAKKYREMAMRELALGRHRRAAYILAELLGDFAEAAEALKQGRFFREAGLLYREHLRNPVAAAQCFAEGGLIEEALAIYEKGGLWLEAADLHARLGNREAECAALRRVVEARLAAGDTVAAARLIETRLREPDEALLLLEKTWPHRANALVCLEERLAMLERQRRPDDTIRLLESLSAETTPLERIADLAGLLAKIFEQTKDARARALAAEGVRMKAAAGLDGRPLDGPDELSLLRSLTRLAPEDRLLKRDVLRFREQRPKEAPLLPLPPVAAGFVRHITPEKTGALSLPLVGGWALAAGDAQHFFAVSQTEQHGVFFCRGSWTQGVQSTSWPKAGALRDRSFFLTSHIVTVILGRPLAEPLELKELPATDTFKSPCFVGTPAWLPTDAVAVSASRFGVWIVRVVGERVVLAHFAQEKLVESRDVTDEIVAAGATVDAAQLVFDARGGAPAVALAFGRHLLVYGPTREVKVTDLGERIIGLVPLHGAVTGWLALLDQGVAFVSADCRVEHRFDDSLVQPRGAYIGDGLAVLVGGEKGLIVRMQSSGPVRLAHFDLTGGPGIAVLPGTNPREFAIFSDKGAVQRWKFAV
jgi:tetratricopeptide (TPR) repeat protein